MARNQFLTANEEKICEYCFKVAAIYNRRERLIAEDQAKLGMGLDPAIKKLIGDLRGWLSKQE